MSGPGQSSEETRSDSESRELLAKNGIDERRLNAMMSEAGFDGDIIELSPSLVGTGQVGENVRCRLRWSEALGQPNSVIIKLPSANATSREAAAATRTYIREVGFYGDVAETVAIAVPTIYHLNEDRPTNTFILVMEDLAPAQVGDQLGGCTLDQAAEVVKAAADLHGSTWDRTELLELDWIDPPTPERRGERNDLVTMLVPGFIDRYQSRLTDRELEFTRRFCAAIKAWSDTQTAARCLVHGDFRLDNLLFHPDDQRVFTVDWQTPNFSSPLNDVAYFLSGSLDALTLQREQSNLLTVYRDRLAHHGVMMSETETFDQYRLASPGGLIMAIIASQIVGQTDRGDEMFMVMAKGSIALADALELPTEIGFT